VRRLTEAAPPAPIPAGTLILLREAPAGPPELLMLERAPDLAFAAGAMVFPGGRVDADDRSLGGDADGAARVAAIRETLEEAGVAIGLSPPPGAAVTTRLRAGLAAGQPLSRLLAAHGLTLVPGALTPYGRWQPNAALTRVFDARFYLADAPDVAAASPDGAECVAAIWTTAAEMLASGRRLLTPTRLTLERLALGDSVAGVLDDARRHPVRLILPRVEEDDRGAWIVIPEGLGYPVTRLPLTPRG